MVFLFILSVKNVCTGMYERIMAIYGSNQSNVHKQDRIPEIKTTGINKYMAHSQQQFEGETVAWSGKTFPAKERAMADC